VLLTEVVRVKPGVSNPFLIVDAAMNDLMRPSLYEAWHSIDAVVPREERMVADVVGPICETGDTFATSRSVERVEGWRSDDHPYRRRLCRDDGQHLQFEAFDAGRSCHGDRWEVIRERRDVEAFLRDENIQRG
jgi:diaminopimelate decarboxylase